MTQDPVRIRREQVVLLLARRGRNQRSVAQAVGMSDSQLSNAVRGLRLLDRAEAAAIAAVLGVEVEEIVEPRGEEVPNQRLAAK